MDTLTQDEEQRVSRLEKYVAKAEQSLESLNKSLQNGAFEAFTEEQIRFHLSHDPDLIADCGLLVAKFRRALTYAELDTKVIKAQLWKRCNQHKESLGLSNAKDREAFVQTDPQYISACQQEFEWRYQLERMQIIYDRYNNLYIASRKLASMFTKEMYDHGI